MNKDFTIESLSPGVDVSPEEERLLRSEFKETCTRKDSSTTRPSDKAKLEQTDQEELNKNFQRILEKIFTPEIKAIIPENEFVEVKISDASATSDWSSFRTYITHVTSGELHSKLAKINMVFDFPEIKRLVEHIIAAGFKLSQLAQSSQQLSPSDSGPLLPVELLPICLDKVAELSLSHPRAVDDSLRTVRVYLAQLHCFYEICRELEIRGKVPEKTASGEDCDAVLASGGVVEDGEGVVARSSGPIQTESTGGTGASNTNSDTIRKYGTTDEEKLENYKGKLVESQRMLEKLFTSRNEDSQSGDIDCQWEDLGERITQLRGQVGASVPPLLSLECASESEGRMIKGSDKRESGGGDLSTTESS
ncbi:hypothetical protein BJ508DRAFT_350438 [Ascobolus immersus RN42]|uniref:Uncharacterized protein n=1 Tax=Ascobolus immersus RN42 TaxID=1160509 RepID=A0A3N4HWS5_ASCIM|nr:hypothetical protein BJ508DRAFT_350438 [Ascobolus immersus RN42]